MGIGRLSVRQLKRRLTALRVDTSACVEKADLECKLGQVDFARLKVGELKAALKGEGSLAGVLERGELIDRIRGVTTTNSNSSEHITKNSTQSLTPSGSTNVSKDGSSSNSTSTATLAITIHVMSGKKQVLHEHFQPLQSIAAVTEHLCKKLSWSGPNSAKLIAAGRVLAQDDVVTDIIGGSLMVMRQHRPKEDLLLRVRTPRNKAARVFVCAQYTTAQVKQIMHQTHGFPRHEQFHLFHKSIEMEADCTMASYGLESGMELLSAPLITVSISMEMQRVPTASPAADAPARTGSTASTTSTLRAKTEADLRTMGVPTNIKSGIGSRVMSAETQEQVQIGMKLGVNYDQSPMLQPSGSDAEFKQDVATHVAAEIESGSAWGLSVNEALLKNAAISTSASTISTSTTSVQLPGSTCRAVVMRRLIKVNQHSQHGRRKSVFKGITKGFLGNSKQSRAQKIQATAEAAAAAEFSLNHDSPRSFGLPLPLCTSSPQSAAAAVVAMVAPGAGATVATAALKGGAASTTSLTGVDEKRKKSKRKKLRYRDMMAGLVSPSVSA
jgi:hypothetical protein